MGFFYLVLFDGSTNVKNYGSIVAAIYPCICVGNGTEHFVSLFFSGVFSKIPEYEQLMNFSKILRNIFGSTIHATTSMFNKYSNIHNRGIKVEFIKPSDCR